MRARLLALPLLLVAMAAVLPLGVAPRPALAQTPPASAVTLTGYDELAQLRRSLAGRSAQDQQRALDAFAARRADTDEGFPLRKGNTQAFLVRATQTPFLAGQWNNWSASAAPLTRLGGTDWWVREETLPAGRRLEYKLVIGGQWRADPLNRKFAYGYRNSVAVTPGAREGHLELVPAFRSRNLSNTRDVILYLPAGYLDAGAERFPVLYAHDGQNLFDPQSMWGGWGAKETLDRLVNAPQGAGIRKVIVVGAANTPDRMNEYTHVVDDISGRCDGSGRMGGKAALYGRFLVDELKPWVDARFRTKAGREDTAILGSSLGGLVSLWIGYAHGNTFRMVAGMSSTLGWGRFCLQNETVEDIARRAGKRDLKIYLDAGGAGRQSPGQDNWGSTESLKLLLESQGYRHGVDLSHWWEPYAPHNEQQWKARLEKPLRFFFGR